MHYKIYFLLVIAFSLSNLACDEESVSNPEINKLEEAKDLWTVNKSSNYTFTYKQVCFCVYYGEMKITVLADSIYSAQYLESGKDVSVIIDDEEVKLVDAYPESLHTIDSLFGILLNAAKNAEEMQGTYDGSIGYPKTVSIDYSFALSDDEITYVLSDYRALSTK